MNYNIFNTTKTLSSNTSNTILEITTKYKVLQISNILSENIINNVIKTIKQNIQKTQKKQVRFSKETKKYDGLHPITNAYYTIIDDFFKGKIKHQNHIKNHPIINAKTLPFVAQCVYSLFTRIQKYEKVVILPGGGKSEKVVRSKHEQSIYILYDMVYKTLLENSYNTF